MLTTLMSALEIKFVFKIETNAWGILSDSFIIKQTVKP